MKKWSIGVIIVLMAMPLVVCTPITEKQKKETVTAAAAEFQEDMIPPSTDGASDKVPDPSVMSVVVIPVYHGGGGSSVQNIDFLDTEGLDAQLLVDKLIEHGMLADGAKVPSFDIEGKDENAVGTLDLSQAESTEGRSGRMFLTEASNTFTENFELSKLKLRVDGGSYGGNDIKQGGSDYLTHNANYESVGQRSEGGGCPVSRDSA